MIIHNLTDIEKAKAKLIYLLDTTREAEQEVDRLKIDLKNAEDIANKALKELEQAKDKLHRRNIQIKHLKECIKSLGEQLEQYTVPS